MKEVFGAYKIGDVVRPKPEWTDDPNDIPSGRVVQIALWGGEGAIHVGDEPRLFAAYVFELLKEPISGDQP